MNTELAKIEIVISTIVRTTTIPAPHIPAEPSKAAAVQRTQESSSTANKPQRITISDLLASGLIHPGDLLELSQPKKGITQTIEVLPDGKLRLPGGEIASTPSRAASMLTGSSCNGWAKIQLPKSRGPLDQLRKRLNRQK